METKSVPGHISRVGHFNNVGQPGRPQVYKKKGGEKTKSRMKSAQLEKAIFGQDQRKEIITARLQAKLMKKHQVRNMGPVSTLATAVNLLIRPERKQ